MARGGRKCADFIGFLAYSGCRKGEAARVDGRHCDFDKGEIAILGDPVTGTKNWEVRRVPMIPDMRRLLERIKDDQGEKEFQANPIMRVHEEESAGGLLGTDQRACSDCAHRKISRVRQAGDGPRGIPGRACRPRIAQG